jgi:FlaA1/EpsC-like NDP-sugar epimerase
VDQDIVLKRSAELAPQRGDSVAERLRRDGPLAAGDLGVAFFSYLLTLVLRFDGAVPDRYWHSFWRFLPVALAIHLVVHQLCGLYGPMWRYASVDEARRVVQAGVISGAAVVAANFLIGWAGGGPRVLPLSVATFGAVLTLLGSGAIRFQSRLVTARQPSMDSERRSVLIVGAGSAGSLIIKDLLRNPSLGLRPVGLVDDDRRKLGRRLHGVPVLGPRTAIARLVEQRQADIVLLAIPSATSEQVRDIATRCEDAGVTLKVLPDVHDIVGGKVSARDIRDLRIEDLLGRKQVETDLEAVAGMLRGRRVLVTGAGGSIGSEIARQVASADPAELVLLDHDETHLHDVVMSLGEMRAARPAAEHGDGMTVTTCLADIRDRERVFSVFMRSRPDIVFHAAAHKHVPVLELHPEEALATNVIGTANLADAAVSTGTERFVLISTDKAINPVSVMGASKWMAEQVVRSLQNGHTVLCAVRFGNVLGSRGSVIPTFFRQIANGGPVTVTDPDMTRYFMSVQEAVQLVLQAAALSVGGEVFTLDMGEPVRILDLAKRLVRLSGRVPGHDVPIEIIGRRPGEKTVEDIVAPDEEPVPSGHPSIVVSRPPVPNRAVVHRSLRELEGLIPEAPPAELAARMKAIASGSRRPPAQVERVIELDPPATESRSAAEAHDPAAHDSAAV